MDNSKKKKINKNILCFYNKLNLLDQQLNFLIINKFINQEIYIEKINSLNNIKINIYELDDHYLKKSKKNIKDDLEKKINTSLEKICEKIGCNNLKNIINIYFPNYNLFEKKEEDIIELYNLYNQYFIPLSSNKLTDIEFFKKKHKIDKIDAPIIIPLIEFSKNKTLQEKIEGATIVIFINNTTLIYINGYFKKDSLSIFKTISNFNTKIKLIEEDIEYINLPVNFKEKYLEQISLKDFIILKPSEISKLLKDDYNDFLHYKNKSISLLIKDFIKMNIEKQRKLIILFLLSDEESQFTAHIIYDLIHDQTFLNNSNQFSDILFNSYHWKIQQMLKKSEYNFEENKKKIESISINDVPYESRILTLKTNDVIKSKAMEKLKEINGSKDNSIKAQQWMDGFLKIPFGIYNKEYIINFFKIYQNKLEKYIEIFTIKISDFNETLLNAKNKINYNIISQIINEFHSNVYLKSENCYDNFISYIEIVKIAIEKELNIENNININNNDYNINNDNKIINNIINADIDNDIINKLIEKNIVPDEAIIDDCINQLNYFKKIKKELHNNNILNKNNLKLMVKKLNDIEKSLNLDKLYETEIKI